MNIDSAGVERLAIDSLVSLSGKRILEVGFGAARETSFLVRLDNTLVAVDPDPSRLALAQQALPGVDFRTLDFLSTNWIQEFDLVVFSMALHHIQGLVQKNLALHKARQALKPGGQILVIEPSIVGTVTRIVCALDKSERQGLQEAREVLDECKKSWLCNTAEVAWWEFESVQEVISFFVDLARRGDPLVTEAQVSGVLDQLNLTGCLRLADFIDFYLL